MSFFLKVREYKQLNIEFVYLAMLNIQLFEDQEKYIKPLPESLFRDIITETKEFCLLKNCRIEIFRGSLEEYDKNMKDKGYNKKFEYISDDINNLLIIKIPDTSGNIDIPGILFRGLLSIINKVISDRCVLKFTKTLSDTIRDKFQDPRFISTALINYYFKQDAEKEIRYLNEVLLK